MTTQKIPRALINFFLLLAISACQASPTLEPLKKIESPFQYYGWIYLVYDQTDNDFARISQYTNTGFAALPEQVKILKEYKFEHVIFLFNETSILEMVWKNEGKEMPTPQNGMLPYEQEIPGFREKFFAAYRDYMRKLHDALINNGTYEQVDIFYIADEPARHGNIYLDQGFLNQYAAEFKKIFPDKKSAITFAQAEITSQADTYYTPPIDLDIIIVDPYFFAEQLGLEKISCEQEQIQEWLYRGNPISSIGWAKQFHKPIIVAGDGQLRSGKPQKDCYLKETYAILQNDPDVAGLIWFIYDRQYQEGDISGGANSPELLRLIESLGR